MGQCLPCCLLVLAVDLFNRPGKVLLCWCSGVLLLHVLAGKDMEVNTLDREDLINEAASI